MAVHPKELAKFSPEMGASEVFVPECPPREGVFLGEGPDPNIADDFRPLHYYETREGIKELEQTPLPTFPDIEIVRSTTKHRKDMDTHYATWYEKRLQLSDGTRFPEFVGIAKNPVNPWPVGKSPAWWTEPDKGYNKTTADKITALRRHMVITGIPVNRANSLYQDAWDVHLALDDVGTEFADELDTSILDQEGDSNGAITAHGVMAYAPNFERSIRDAFLIDQCLIRPISGGDVKKFMQHPEYAAREALSLGRQVLRLVKDRNENIRHFAKTVGHSSEYVIGNLLLTRHLFAGEQGHLLAHIPQEQRSHELLMDFSIANQKRTFVRILRGSSGLDRQGMTTEVVTGTHMSLTNPHHQNAKVLYLARIDQPDYRVA